MIKIKNIVVSGTNFWNAGDDFVRDGVIRILNELFEGYHLNFLFYNFNQDFFPQNKFSGISNTVAKGDLNKYYEFIDAVVIAGLSAGSEIKDLYNWIIENGLEDRVYLIGAGYENDYVARYIYQEPEATIFRKAKIITGRTEKTPKFIRDLSLPYHHVNCPAILSVPQVRQIPNGKKIEKIGFSIQLPHNVGIANHCCSAEMHNLAVKILLSLKSKYSVEVIAHHKTEYFHFLNLLKGTEIPVIFSSFYQDLSGRYKEYDLVITTRLHSSLYANGHGIPGIIINDTDRHTHCLNGFPHSVWVNSEETFRNSFNAIQMRDLKNISIEAEEFKKNLLKKYVDLLKKPFGVETDSDYTNSDISENIRSGLGGSIHKYRVLEVLKRLTPNTELLINIERFEKAVNNKESWFNNLILLNWYAYYFLPKNYLEAGSQNLSSLVQVLISSTDTDSYLFNLRTLIDPDGSIEEEQFLRNELAKLGIPSSPHLLKGNSYENLLNHWKDSRLPQRLGLIKINGSCLNDNAGEYLDVLFNHLAGGGLLVVDNTSLPENQKFKKQWQEFKSKNDDCIFLADETGNGSVCVFRPSFDSLVSFLEDSKMQELPIQVFSGEASDLAVRANQIKTSNEVFENGNSLPVHFFTIVLNGEPFIRHHIEVFKQLPFDWHWHIIEGVADLKHDTAWSTSNGGSISGELHSCGLSNDGTTQYIDDLKNEFEGQVTIYRKPGGKFWDGKLEMVNSPLENIKEECLLWQLDADELWTVGQIVKAREIFINNPQKTAAYYRCHFFVGEKLIITTRDTYGNHTGYEWLRTWRFQPGDRWESHEPPRLCRKNSLGQTADLATINPILHDETEIRGLVFEHYAYANKEQVRFKEVYYGYKNACSQWRSLNSSNQFPVKLSSYFGWVKDNAKVDTISSRQIKPLASKDLSNKWKFKQQQEESGSPQKIIWLRPDAIGDNVLAASMLEQLHKEIPDAKITVVCQIHIADIYKSSPFVDKVIVFDRRLAISNNNYRNEIILKMRRTNSDLLLNTVYSREPLTDFLALACGVKKTIAFDGNNSNMDEKTRLGVNRNYSKIIASGGSNKNELERYQEFMKEIGLPVPDLEPVIWLDEEDIKYAENFFRNHQLDSQKTIALFAGAQNGVRIYESYGKALSKICSEKDYSVIALGSEADESINRSNLDSISTKTINLSGATNIRQSAAIISRCCLAVGAETGLAHIACAVKTPNVILLGGGHFGRFMPYSKYTTVVSLPLECYGCNWQCRFEKVHCVKDISSDVIEVAIRETLLTRSDKPRIFVQGISLWQNKPEQPNWQWFDDLLPLESAEIIPVGKIPNFPSLQDKIQKAEQEIQKGNLIKAKEILEMVIKKDPYCLDALNDLSVVEISLKNFDAASKTLKKVLELNSSNEVALENQRYLDDQINLRNELLFSERLVRENNLAKAKDILLNILENDSLQIDAMNILAIVEIKGHNYSAAVELLKKVLSLDADNQIAIENLTSLKNEFKLMKDDNEK